MTAAVAAAGVFTARTLIELSKAKASTAMCSSPIEKSRYQGHVEYLQAIVTVSDSKWLESIAATGARVISRFGTTATVIIPINALPQVAAVDGVKRIELAKRVELCNDKALELSRFPAMTVAHGDFTSPAYTGNGVVVGVIDVGVDFNHINFLDKEGNNRIVRVYMPADSTGVAPIVDGVELPGSEYTTPESIRELTTDDSTAYHGTHTAGTAAGSYLDNGYHGVATGAQLVVCAMPESKLTDFNIANSVKYIFDYASKANLPAVINMSLGSQDGPHDGSSTLCRLFDEVSGPGRICVVSAGNDGNMPINISKTFSENDSLATFLTNWYGRPVMQGYSSMWSRSSERHSVDLGIWDINDKKLLYRLPIPSEAPLDSVFMISSETDSVFAQYFEGDLYFACTVEDNGLFHSLVETNYSTHDRTRYRIGLVHKAPAGETLMGWCGGMPVYSKSGVDGWTGAVAANCCTVSDLATASQVISVGAYCSSNSFVMMDGSNKIISDSYPCDIAKFSGFGPDALNRPRPDVVAPGYMVASSVNRYDERFKNLANVVDVVSIDGEYYPYGLEGGTSMSAPVAAGAFALWLEIDPLLTPSRLREVMAATCYRDTYVEAGPAKKWGYGKLDINAGIKYLLGRLNGDVDGDGAVTSADVTCLYNLMLGISMHHVQRADVDLDGAITSTDITLEYNKILDLE